MKTINRSKTHKSGTTLIEAVVAIGVLSVTIPLVFGSLAESGKSGNSSATETRSIWIVPACLEEIEASRAGRSQYFPNTAAQEEFPSAGGVWALAFNKEGKPVSALTSREYEKGTKAVGDQKIAYIAHLQGSLTPSVSGSFEMTRVKITMEYPASAPADKRQKLDFYTQVP